MNENQTVTETIEDVYNGNRASYTPEDDKIRLYVGRVPRDEYLKLRSDGWVSTPKQNCDFVATWTPSRRDTALEYAGIIEDEDMGPAERAADRAERFGDYRDKRTSEAVGHADRFDSGPIAHGYQSQARADRAVARHDRIAAHACDAWSKAEYWTRRTAGVIDHALYKSSPGVRMGRIKTIEADLRKERANIEDCQKRYRTWQKIAAMTDPVQQTEIALRYTGNSSGDWGLYKHPVSGREVHSLYSLLSSEKEPITGAQAVALFFENHAQPKDENDWTQHYQLRLAYENQMLQAQGGRAAFVEMQVGGWIGKHQIRKVNKSPATGRVVSVEIMGEHTGFTKESGYTQQATRPCPKIVNIERLPENAYRPPTPEDIQNMISLKESEKAIKPKAAPCPLVNPTDQEAERLQAAWNAIAKAKYDANHDPKWSAPYEPATVCRITQAVYSQNSKGSFARAETRGLCGDAMLKPRETDMYSRKRDEYIARIGPALCKVRITSGGGSHSAYRVIVLTDKPQSELPASVWQPYVAPVQKQTPETVNA